MHEMGGALDVRESVEDVWNGFTRKRGEIIQITAGEWAVL